MSRPAPTERSVRSGIGQPAAAPDSHRRSSMYTTTAIPDDDLMQIARVQWERMFPSLSTMRTGSTPSPSAQEAGTSLILESTQPGSIDVPSLPIPNASGLLSEAALLWRRLLPGTTASPRMSMDERRPTTLTSQNCRANTWWGDELDVKPPSTTRIYAINLNGISLDKRGGQFDIHCRVLKEVQVDIFCGQEHNLDTTQANLRTILHATASQHWERYKLTFGTTPIPFPRSFKPGGTMLLTVGSLTGRVKKQTRDKWGRWVSQEYQGSHNRVLVVITAHINRLFKEKWQARSQ